MKFTSTLMVEIDFKFFFFFLSKFIYNLYIKAYVVVDNDNKIWRKIMKKIWKADWKPFRSLSNSCHIFTIIFRILFSLSITYLFVHKYIHTYMKLEKRTAKQSLTSKCELCFWEIHVIPHHFRAATSAGVLVVIWSTAWTVFWSSSHMALYTILCLFTADCPSKADDITSMLQRYSQKSSV